MVIRVEGYNQNYSHTQSIEDETLIREYNSSKSPRYLAIKIKRYAELTRNKL